MAKLYCPCGRVYEAEPDQSPVCQACGGGLTETRVPPRRPQLVWLPWVGLLALVLAGLLYLRLDAVGYFTPSPSVVRAKFFQQLRQGSARWAEPDWSDGECSPRRDCYQVTVRYRGERRPYVFTLAHGPPLPTAAFEVKVHRAGPKFEPAERVARVTVADGGIRFAEGATPDDDEERELLGRLATDLACALGNSTR